MGLFTVGGDMFGGVVMVAGWLAFLNGRYAKESAAIIMLRHEGRLNISRPAAAADWFGSVGRQCVAGPDCRLL